MEGFRGPCGPRIHFLPWSALPPRPPVLVPSPWLPLMMPLDCDRYWGHTEGPAFSAHSQPKAALTAPFPAL